jgi:hypothetical protein
LDLRRLLCSPVQDVGPVLVASDRGLPDPRLALATHEPVFAVTLAEL